MVLESASALVLASELVLESALELVPASLVLCLSLWTSLLVSHMFPLPLVVWGCYPIVGSFLLQPVPLLVSLGQLLLELGVVLALESLLLALSLMPESELVV